MWCKYRCFCGSCLVTEHSNEHMWNNYTFRTLSEQETHLHMLELFIAIYLLTGRCTHLQLKRFVLVSAAYNDEEQSNKQQRRCPMLSPHVVHKSFLHTKLVTESQLIQGPVWLCMCLDDPPISRQVISQSQSKNIKRLDLRRGSKDDAYGNQSLQIGGKHLHIRVC